MLLTALVLSTFAFCGGLCLTPYLGFEPAAPQPELDVQEERRNSHIPFAFSPDSSWLCYVHNRTLFWRSLRGEANHSIPVPDAASALAVTHHSRVIVAFSGTGSELHASPSPGSPLEPLMKLDHRDEINVVAMAASPVEDLLAVTLSYHKRRSESVTEGLQALETYRGGNRSSRKVLVEDPSSPSRLVKFSHDGRFIIGWEYPPERLVIRNASEGDPAFGTQPAWRGAFCLSVDGAIISGHSEGWQRTIPTEGGRDIDLWLTRGEVADCEFHPGGKLVAVCRHGRPLAIGAAYWKSTLHIRDLNTKRTRSCRVFDDGAEVFALSRDGRYVAVAGGRDGRMQLKLWKWEDLDR